MKTIYLEIDDEVTSVIDKVKKSNSDDIALVIPKGATILQSIVNLKILKAESKSLQKQIIIITKDLTGRNLASRVGFTIKQRVDGDTIESIPFKELEPEEPQSVSIDIDEFLDPIQTEKELTITTETKKSLFQTIDEEKQLDDQPSWIRERVKQRLQTHDQLSAKDNDHPPSQGHEEPQSQTDRIAFAQPLKRKLSIFRKRKRQSRKQRIALLPVVSLKMILTIMLPTLVLGGLLGFLILPKAHISLIAKSEPISQIIVLELKQDITNTETGALPGKTFSVEEELVRSFQTSGRKKIGEKSKGNVLFTNQFSSEAQTFTKGTKIKSREGKIYILSQHSTIPGARVESGKTIPGRIHLPIEAEEFGEEYNIETTKFSIIGLSPAMSSDIFGETDEPIIGGTSHEVQALTQGDVNNAKKVIEQELQTSLEKKIDSQIEQGYIVAQGAKSTKTTKATTNTSVDSEADTFELRLMMKTEVLAFLEQDALQLAEKKLSLDVPQHKHVIEDESKNISFTLREVNFERGMAELEVFVEKKIAWDIDTEFIKQQTRGMSREEAERFLTDFDKLDTYSIQLWPFWVDAIPRFPKKIEVTLDNF